MNNFKKILLSLLFISINYNCDSAICHYCNTQESDLSYEEFIQYIDNSGNEEEYKKYKNEEEMLKERGDKKFLHRALLYIYNNKLLSINNEQLEGKRKKLKESFFEDFKRQYARLNNIKYEELNMNDDLLYCYFIKIEMPYDKIIYLVDEIRNIGRGQKFRDIEIIINNQVDLIFNKIEEIRNNNKN